MSALSDWIKERRKILGYTQAQVASKLGIHQAQVSGLEGGKFMPDSEMMTKIDTVFGKFAGAYIPVQSSPGTKKIMSVKAREGLQAYRESKENCFYLELDNNTHITADRNQYILKQGTNTSYFTELKMLLKFLVTSNMRQSDVSTLQEILNKLDEIYKLIEIKFDNYDPANVAITSRLEEDVIENDEV